MPGVDPLSPATTQYAISSRGVAFDPKQAGKTEDENYDYLIYLLLGPYAENIVLPDDATAEDLRDFLNADFRVKIPKNNALEQKLNAMAPDIVHDFYEDLYNQLRWSSKVVPEPDKGDGRYYRAVPQKDGKGAVGTAADPVNLFNGRFAHSEADLQLDGAGCRFIFTRSYRQASGYNGPLGHNWDHNYNLWLKAAGDRTWANVSLGEGPPSRFRRHEIHDYFVPPEGTFEILLEAGAGFELRSPEGGIIEFRPHDYLEDVFVASQISDRFGNYQKLSYSDGLLRTVEVNHPGRTASFGYDEIDRIVAVSDFAGRTWRYFYDDLGDLAAVNSPTTDQHKRGLATRYYYSSAEGPGAPHNLTGIVDPGGWLVLENEYGTDAGLLSFNRVVRQRQGGGDTIFEYSDVVEDFDVDYAEHERPAFETLVTEPDGRQVRHLFNGLGNTILRQEYARLDGMPKIVTTHMRYNRDGNLIGLLSPLGVLTQYHFGRDDYERSLAADETYRAVGDPGLDPATLLGFNNLLATVKRARYLNISLSGSSGALWSTGMFQDVFDTDPEDVIVKFTYDPQFNLMLSSSDPRFTQSADPEHQEGQDYFEHLTRYAYEGPKSVLGSVTLPSPVLPDGTSSGPIVTTFPTYDEKGRLLETLGPNGLRTIIEYFGSSDGLREGFLKTVTVDPAGENVQTGSERDELGRVIKVLRPEYQPGGDRFSSTLTYNDLDQVIENRSTPPFDVAERYLYDRSGKLQWASTDLKDEENVLQATFEVRNRYDGQSHLVRRTEGDFASATTRLSRVVFDATGRPAVSIRPSGYRSKYAYGERGLKTKGIEDFGASNAITKLYHDADGRLVRQIDPLGSVIAYAYDALGRINKVTDPLGHPTVFHYDKAHNLVARLQYEAVGESEYRLLVRRAFTYDAVGRRILETVNRFEVGPAVAEAELGQAFRDSGPGDLLTTQYYYDEASRLVRVVDPGSRAVEYRYDPLGRITRRTDPLGNEETYRFDKENRLVRIDQRELVYDESGSVVAEEHFARSQAYDELGRLVEQTDPLGNRWSFKYDSRGNRVRTLGPGGSLSQNLYDIFSRPTRRRDRVAGQGGAADEFAETQFAYTRGDQLAQVTDPLGRTTSFQYDSAGRRRSTVLPDGSSDELTYNGVGKVVSFLDRNKLRKGFTYDAVHRNIEIAVDGSALDPSLTLGGAKLYKTRYDALGRTIVAENEGSRIQRSYNSLSEALSEVVTFSAAGAPAGLTIERRFDDTGMLRTIRYPSGRAIALDRDALDRLNSVRQTSKGAAFPGDPGSADAALLAKFSYQGLRTKSVGRRDGTRSRFRYDKAGRLIGIEHGSEQAPIFETQLLYDGASNLRRAAERGPTGNVLRFHQFDCLYRLTETTAGPAGPFVDWDALSPSAEPLPDPIPQSQEAIDLFLDGSGTATSAAYFYDAMGNRLSASIDGTNTNYQPNDLDQYAGGSRRHDGNGNLIEDESAVYIYDHANQMTGLRIKATGEEWTFGYDALGRRCMVKDASGTRFLIYDGMDAIEEYRGQELVASSIFAGGRTLLQISQDGGEFSYLTDLRGSTRCLVESGMLAGAFSYGDFGELTIGVPTRDEEYLYAGKRLLRAAGKYEYYSRFYDPAVGRFLQRDPAGFADGLNLYAYVGNNPLTFGDPLGTEREPLLLGKHLGANFMGGSIDFSDPNLGMDRISKFYFRDDGLLLRWSEREQSWIEDYTGSMFVEGVAPKPKGSRLERYLKGVKGAVMAPVHLAKDTAFKVVDMSTQGFAVVGKLTGGWDVGYTTLSSTSQAVEAGVPQSEILWHATGGLVVDPMLAFGDQLVAFGSGNMDLWEFAGNVTGTIMRDTFAGQVGSYLKVKGHHIHQSAAYRKTIGINPNHGEAIAIQQGVPGFTFKDHDLASAAQRNINRGMWDKEVKLDQLRPTPGSDPVLKIGAEGNVAPRMLPSGKLAKSFEPMPSPWFEDIKAFYSLRAAGISPDMAYGLVDRSAKQIATKGILPVRVPTR